MFLANYFGDFRSISLINTVLLIPILASDFRVDRKVTLEDEQMTLGETNKVTLKARDR